MSDFFNIIRYHKGIELIRKGKIREAAEYYEEKLLDNPSSIFLHLETARSYFKLGDMPNSKKHLLNIIEADASKKNITAILEITNWRMISSFRHFNQTPAFSPCGRFLVYASARHARFGTEYPTISDKPALYRYNLSTGEEELMVDETYYNSSPCFSPDGTKLLFLSARQDTDGNKIIDHRDNRGLYLLDLSSGKEELLIEDEHKVKHASFSPDGKKIIYYCTRKNAVSGNIYLLTLDDRLHTNLTPDDYESTFPSISPDGERFVFASWRRDTNNDGLITIRDNSGIYVRELNSFSEITVASDRYDSLFPIFSPDGRYIIYLARRHDTNRDGVIDSQDNPGIYRFDIKKLKEKVLVNDDHYNKFPVISLDGTNLIFMSSWIRKKDPLNIKKDYFEKKGIYVMDLRSWKISPIVNDKYFSSHAPVVSPDGQWVAYTSWRHGTCRGLYMAQTHRLPSKEAIISYINYNL